MRWRWLEDVAGSWTKRRSVVGKVGEAEFGERKGDSTSHAAARHVNAVGPVWHSRQLQDALDHGPRGGFEVGQGRIWPVPKRVSGLPQVA